MTEKKTENTSLRQLIAMIAVIALPVALQNLLTTTGSMVDTMMIASLGEKSVGAVGLWAAECCFSPSTGAREIMTGSAVLTDLPSAS